MSNELQLKKYYNVTIYYSSGGESGKSYYYSDLDETIWELDIDIENNTVEFCDGPLAGKKYDLKEIENKPSSFEVSLEDIKKLYGELLEGVTLKDMIAFELYHHNLFEDEQ